MRHCSPYTCHARCTVRTHKKVLQYMRSIIAAIYSFAVAATLQLSHVLHCILIPHSTFGFVPMLEHFALVVHSILYTFLALSIGATIKVLSSAVPQVHLVGSLSCCCISGVGSIIIVLSNKADAAGNPKTMYAHENALLEGHQHLSTKEDEKVVVERKNVCTSLARYTLVQTICNVSSISNWFSSCTS
eukprot:c9025_g1_i1 orf=57-620(+)